MTTRSRLTALALFFPGAASACGGGGGPDYVGIALLIALFILMASAFLLPLAGILALMPRKPATIVRLFSLYCTATVAMAMSAILVRPSDYVTVTLILLCAMLLVAPSVHYLVHTMRAVKVNEPS